MQVRCNSANVSPCSGWTAARGGSHVVSAIMTQRRAPAAAGDRGGMSGAEAIRRRAADKQKNDNLRGHRHRPKRPDGIRADPGRLPANYGKAVVHRVAAEDQGGDENDAAIRRKPQQRCEAPDRAIGRHGSSGILDRQRQNWHEASGKCGRGEQPGTEPTSRRNPELRDGLTGKQGSANERRGATTTEPAIVETSLGSTFGWVGRRTGGSERIGQRGKRRQCC